MRGYKPEVIMDKSELKEQRDRFCAFSFATSDVLLEADNDGYIVFTTGAVKGFMGVGEDYFSGKNWLDIFDRTDRTTLLTLTSNTMPGKRCGPVLVQLAPEIGDGKKVIFAGIRVDENSHFFMSLSQANVLAAKLGGQNRKAENNRLLGKEEFLQAAQDVLMMAKSVDQGAKLTMVDVGDADKARKRLGQANFDLLKDDLAEFLKLKSLDGETAAEIGEGKFSLVHDENVSTGALVEKIEELSRQRDPKGKGLEFRSKTVDPDLSSLSEKETSRALFYTMSEFEKKGTDLTIESLGSSFQAYVTANAHKMAEFKEIVSTAQFNMHFQPIVDLETGEASHFEMLARFKDGTPPFEWICFAEDTGMITDFDMAVFERAMNYIIYKANTNRMSFAVNVSGKSIEDPDFFLRFMNKIREHEDVCERMLVEITESTAISNLEQVAVHLDKLHEKGFKCCLDDFGAGAASFQYLHKLNVDYVKIDGAYVKNLLEDKKNMMMVKNLTQMCKDLNVKVIAEYVETQTQADRLKNMGVDYGQGFLFSKPLTQPSYQPKISQTV